VISIEENLKMFNLNRMIDSLFSTLSFVLRHRREERFFLRMPHIITQEKIKKCM
jgi:hypothetical protein